MTSCLCYSTVRYCTWSWSSHVHDSVNIGPQTDNGDKLIVQLGVTGSFDNWISLLLTWA